MHSCVIAGDCSGSYNWEGREDGSVHIYSLFIFHCISTVFQGRIYERNYCALQSYSRLLPVIHIYWMVFGTVTD